MHTHLSQWTQAAQGKPGTNREHTNIGSIPLNVLQMAERQGRVKGGGLAAGHSFPGGKGMQLCLRDGQTLEGSIKLL